MSEGGVPIPLIYSIVSKWSTDGTNTGQEDFVGPDNKDGKPRLNTREGTTLDSTLDNGTTSPSNVVTVCIIGQPGTQ